MFNVHLPIRKAKMRRNTVIGCEKMGPHERFELTCVSVLTPRARPLTTLAIFGNNH